MPLTQNIGILFLKNSCPYIFRNCSDILQKFQYKLCLSTRSVKSATSSFGTFIRSNNTDYIRSFIFIIRIMYISYKYFLIRFTLNAPSDIIQGPDKSSLIRPLDKKGRNILFYLAKLPNASRSSAETSPVAIMTYFPFTVSAEMGSVLSKPMLPPTASASYTEEPGANS